MTSRRFVVANELVNENSEQPRIFRTYENHGHGDEHPITPGYADSEFIWQVGRATAAAPTFFEPIQIGHDFYSDGGFGYNNPAEEGYEEVLHGEAYYENSRKQPKGQTPIPIKLLLSIGTGGDDENLQPQGPSDTRPNDSDDRVRLRRRVKLSFIAHFRSLTQRLQRQATEAMKVDRQIRRKSRREGWQYVRWVGGKDLAKHKMDKWEAGTRMDIEKWVKDYMHDPRRQEEVKRVAHTLVDIRRQRVQYGQGDRWQRFTYCSHIPCAICHIGRDHLKETGTQATLMAHVRENHVSNTHAQQVRDWGRVAPKVVGGPR